MLWTDPQDAQGRGPSKRVRFLPVLARPHGATTSLTTFSSFAGRRHRFRPRRDSSLDRKERGDGRHSLARGAARRLLGRARWTVYHRLLGAQLRAFPPLLAFRVRTDIVVPVYVGRSGRQPRCIRYHRRHGRYQVHDLLGAASSCASSRCSTSAHKLRADLPPPPSLSARVAYSSDGECSVIRQRRKGAR